MERSHVLSDLIMQQYGGDSTRLIYCVFGFLRSFYVSVSANEPWPDDATLFQPHESMISQFIKLRKYNMYVCNFS